MARSRGIAVHSHGGPFEEVDHVVERRSSKGSVRRYRSRNHRTTARPYVNALGEHLEEPEDTEVRVKHPVKGNHRHRGLGLGERVRSFSSSQEADSRVKFYDKYYKVAEGYDKVFMKKHDEDLNTTLIFAGLFSAVTSAFIVDINQQLHSDPNEENSALLRVLIHKIDNTAFGGTVPTVPEWTGPPRTAVQVQSILFSSLAASLFSALLAMLGKQWLTRYVSVDVRGSAIERSQHRQRKLNGIITWYFEYVMEFLPIMLQLSLLLLGCALSQHLWAMDTTIASVVLGATAFGVLAYTLIVIMGMLSENCPYQTPGSHIIRYLWRKSQSLRRLLDTTYSSFRKIHVGSVFLSLLRRERRWSSEPWWSKDNVG
ncbi:hypothetical protein BDM02DRAFT_480916 [Thelephora ganbajun]|uniref:Uncharacterized protein n=1 Tax=Thelephora ganbajun TaxID=370292 RepID=A0ACB6Z7Z0_THEGA|nr:hypothetical protein BDM02DRAFT_480916 [Thelephora ganbajun]